MPRDVVTLFAQDEGYELVKKHCRNIAFPVESLRELAQAVVEKSTMQRRLGLYESFEEILLASLDGDGH